ncbi:hypothetical protein SNEBB_006305 [Seison nebaliae]|nr:hypothetical protein SNEBB_006305 [Seison nebaliae]
MSKENGYKVDIRIEIRTAEEKESNTTAKPFIILEDDDNHIILPRTDLPVKDKAFAVNSADEFDFKTESSDWKLKKLTLGHNNKGRSPDWKVDYVKVWYDEKDPVLFEFDCWIGSKKGDSLMVTKDAKIEEKAEKKVIEENKCRIKVVMDAIATEKIQTPTMILDIEGTNGKIQSHPLQLECSDKLFSKSEEETFVIYPSPCGRWSKVTLRYDYKAIVGGWSVDYIEIERPHEDVQKMPNRHKYLSYQAPNYDFCHFKYSTCFELQLVKKMKSNEAELNRLKKEMKAEKKKIKKPYRKEFTPQIASISSPYLTTAMSENLIMKEDDIRGYRKRHTTLKMLDPKDALMSEIDPDYGVYSDLPEYKRILEKKERQKVKQEKLKKQTETTTIDNNNNKEIIKS